MAEHVVVERPEQGLLLDGAIVGGNDRNTNTESAPVELRIFGIPNCPGSEPPVGIKLLTLCGALVDYCTDWASHPMPRQGTLEVYIPRSRRSFFLQAALD